MALPSAEAQGAWYVCNVVQYAAPCRIENEVNRNISSPATGGEGCGSLFRTLVIRHSFSDRLSGFPSLEPYLASSYGFAKSEHEMWR